MFVRNAAALLLTVGSLRRDALAELITITQYPSTCSAIYTTGTRSVTIVQSTITVVPVPYDDAAWNGGTPFVLEIEPDTPTDPLARRQSLAGRSWVGLNGNTSTQPLLAGQYYIKSGQLMSVNGSYVSTNLNVQNQPFSVLDTPSSISTTFTFKDGILNWTSPRFTGGRAKFCKLPADRVDNAQVLAQFLGPVYAASSCAPIRFRARPCSEVNPLSCTSSILTGTISVSSSISMQSMSSGPPGKYTPPPYTNQQPSSTSSVAGPSISTPPPPYIDSTSSRAGPSSSVSGPPVYPSASISSIPSSLPSPTPYTRTSSSPLDSVSSSSSANPPIYGSVTPSPSRSSSSGSSTSSLTFASSGSPIGPINPPPYVSTSSISSSVSSSMSISSGGVRSSESASSSSTSSLSLPPIYTPPPPIYTPPSSSSTSGSSSSTGTLPPAIISIVSSGSRPPSSTSSSASSSQSPPVVYPEGSSSSSSTSASQSPPVVYPVTSTSSSTSSSQSPPIVYPITPSTSSSSSQIGSSSTVASSSSPIANPPFYTSSPQPCPEGNNSIYINTAGFAYTIYCGLDSSPASYGAPLDLDFPSCIQRCDFDPSCGAVAHLGEATCYLKPTPQSYYPGGERLAVRLSGTPPVYPGASSTSSSASSSVAPPQYETTTSSSIGQSTTSSSSISSSATSTWSSSSSIEVPPQYEGPTTTTTTTTTSSSSIEVPIEYEPTTTSSTSSEVLEEYEQTTTSSSSSSPFPTTTTTTTTTTSSSSSSSSAASSTIPYSQYLVLPSPTPCDFGDPPDFDEDDSYCDVDLPFDIQLFGVSSSHTFASSNGYVGLNRGSSQYQVNRFPITSIPENSIAPFFDDLMVHGKKNPRQGIYYQIEGTKVTYEWYVGRSGLSEPDKARYSRSIYHFTLEYDSATPNAFIYTYYSVGSSAADIGDQGVNGAVAAVGIQAQNAEGTRRGQTYSFREAKITPRSQVRCTLSETVNECALVPNPVLVTIRVSE